MKKEDTRFYQNTDICLTPWQQECETKIVRNELPELFANLLRRLYEQNEHIKSIQHWAGDNYSSLLIYKAEEAIKAIPLNPFENDRLMEQADQPQKTT